MTRTILKIVAISGISFVLGVLLTKILFITILPIQRWYFERYVKPYDPEALLSFMFQSFLVVPLSSFSLTAVLAGYLLRSRWWLYPLIVALVVALLQTMSAYEYSLLPRYTWDWELIAFYLIFVPLGAWFGHFVRSHWKGRLKGQPTEPAS